MPIETIQQKTTFLTSPVLFMSYENFLAWDHEGELIEWEQGKVIFHAMPKHEHQTVVGFLMTLLRLFVELYDLGIVQIAPFLMRVKPEANGREPDLFFLATQHMSWLTSNELKGPADLVVEIVSDESAFRDYKKKFLEYQDGGVREYWIIDPRPNKTQAFFYVLDETGTYQLMPIVEGIYHSTVLANFWLDTNWLWNTQTNALKALKEIVGAEKLMMALDLL